jgi:hypothetical protein
MDIGKIITVELSRLLSEGFHDFPSHAFSTTTSLRLLPEIWRTNFTLVDIDQDDARFGAATGQVPCHDNDSLDYYLLWSFQLVVAREVNVRVMFVLKFLVFTSQ